MPIAVVPQLVVTLAAELRRRGVPVASSDVIDAARALLRVDLGARDEVCGSLRATLAKSQEDAAILDQLLDRYLPRARPGVERSGVVPSPEAGDGTGSEDGDGAAPGDAPSDEDLLHALRAGDDAALEELAERAVDTWSGLDQQVRGERHHTARVLRGMGLDAVLRQLIAAGRPDGETERRLSAAEAERDVRALIQMVERLVGERLAALHGPDASADERLDALPILTAGPDELDALRRAVRPLARQIAARLGRRRRRGSGHLDMRRTIRSSMASGGVPLAPVLRRRRPTRPELVVLCDVSGSVAQFAPFTLALLHALQDEFQRVRSWVFIDGIVEISGLLEESNGMLDARQLLGRRGLVEGDGRSDYAGALRSFLERWPSAIGPRTTLLLVGDARSHDRSPALAELAELHRRCRHLYWFNPEPAAEWDTGDSLAGDYAAHADLMREVSTLRQLGDAVAALR
ncbi:VWA domain-containing protein [Blastococcus sp. SYSU D00820]